MLLFHDLLHTLQASEFPLPYRSLHACTQVLQPRIRIMRRASVRPPTIVASKSASPLWVQRGHSYAPHLLVPFANALAYVLVVKGYTPHQAICCSWTSSSMRVHEMELPCSPKLYQSHHIWPLWVSSNLQPLASRSICTDEQPASLILMPLQGPPCVTESPTTTHIVVHLWPVCISVDVCWHRFRARSKRAYNRARGLICSQVCLRRACPLSQIHTGEGFPHSTYKYLGTVKFKKLGIS